MDRTTRILLTASRLLVGLLFVLSGLIKVNDLTGFLFKLEEYFYVFSEKLGATFLEALLPHTLSIAWGIAVLEVFLGVTLLLGVLRWLTTVLLALLMVFFTLLTGYSAVTGAVTDCGCFGDVLKISPWVSFGKDVVLLFLAFFLQVYREDLHPIFKKKAIGIGIASLVLVVVNVATYTFYHHLPLLDFRPYAVGQNIEKNLEPSEDGLPKAKDYVRAATVCDSSELTGSALLIVSYELAKADSLYLKEAIELGNTLDTSGVKTFLLTASVSAVRDSVLRKYTPTFCVVPHDQTVLKTIVRANPGYVLLQEGTIQRKWHFNDTPSAEAVLKAAGK